MSLAAILPWHKALWSVVCEARANDKLAHALLLAGPAGVGKRQFARALAQALLCESPDQQGEACGKCRGCVQFEAGSHPNLYWLQPLFDDKTDKQKRDISVEQLRDLGEKLVLSAYYGGSKVVVMDPADALNVNGVNALLKTIEEPPPKTYMLLVSERPMALAATLRSRCQRLRFTPPAEAEARAWLREQEPALSAVALERTLDLAQGAPLRALAGHKSGLLEQQGKWRSDWLEVAASSRAPTAAAVAVGKDREQVSAWIAAFIAFLGELLRARVSGQQAGDLGQVPGRIGMTGLQAMLDEAYDAARRITTSASPQLVVESLMIAWWRWSMARGAAAR
ncbi:MAG: polymerase-3 subunit delta [Hydrocarboniphaga sp.]|uniref:DNA polymerase III subunit delta' n=1 Tax=Hydrocarboniphaga sp. TaxID=2033016 RepID=UPI0026258916|nr:DNA polymerase III subunit delta' [Hydrocarboniphaga sp.]MDB5968056.1 polymerase-3 subunit delta [Hydrocarboniphaga sp.]